MSLKIKKLFHGDELIKSLFKNAGVLFIGNLGASVLGFISLALTARSIGSQGLGTLVLVTTYVLVVDKLINFQSWQTLIKYGSEELKSNNKDNFKSIIKFGYLLDIGTALLGAIVGAGGAWFFGQWQDWPPDAVAMASIYSVTILTHIAGVPTAVLRLYDRFKLFASVSFVASAIKLIGILIVSFITSDLWIFIFVWGLADVVGNILLLIYSHRELAKHGYVKIRTASVKRMATRFPGIWGFAVAVNLNGSIRLLSKEADVFFIGALLTPAAVGLYKIAKQLANVLAMLIDPLYQAIYPALTKLYAAGNHIEALRLARRTAILASIVSLICFGILAIIAEPLLLNIFGREFTPAKDVMLWYAFAIVLALASFPLSPLIVAGGNPKVLLATLLISTALYFSALPWLISNNGLDGAGMAYVAFYVSWLTLSMAFVIYHGRKFLKEKYSR